MFWKIHTYTQHALESVYFYLDEKECIQILWPVCERFNDFRVHININKCQFFVLSVKYLGHIIGDGKLYPNPEKVKAVVNARTPNNIKELKSYLKWYGFECL